MDEYENPCLDRWTTDNYFVRRSIADAMLRSRSHFSGVVLDVGCGKSPYKRLLMSPPSRATRYLGLDLINPLYTSAPDLVWDGRQIPLDPESVDTAVATEVLEHSPTPAAVLAEIYRVLKSGGFFLMTVPFLWPLHDVPHDEFRYTPFSLRRMMENAGFSRIEIGALGGWDASLATMIGLWIHRRPMNERVRSLLSRLAFPVYRRLIRMDSAPAVFDRSVMITGLTARAWKE